MLPNNDLNFQSTSRTFTLKELFNNNFFTIPDYQRGYSWETEHLEDLIKDIENIAKLENKHYTGTIVAAINEKSNYFELVDGQQRLTTLIILLNEIYHLDKMKFEEIKQLFIIRGKKGEEILVFTPNLETRICFQQVIIDRKTYQPSIKSHEAIINAKDFFGNYLSKNLSQIELIYATIIHKLNFLFFTPEHNKEIGIMFEVINNRGKKLSELEKIKNFFIYYATVHNKHTLRDDINQLWVDIQINLSQAHRTSNDDENAFLRYCYLVYFKPSKDKSWNVYDECKKEFDVNNEDEEYVDKVINRMRGFVSFLTDGSLSYAWFYNNSYFISTYKGNLKNELSKCLIYLLCQSTSASIMPLYLSIMSRLDEPVHVVRLLKILEVLNMRLYIMPGILNRADSKQSDLFIFAYEFYNDREWHSNEDPSESTYYTDKPIVGDIFEWLYFNLSEISYHFCDEEKFKQSLILEDSELFNFYRWQGIRYFLACYEEHIRFTQAKRSFDIQRILSGKKVVGENLNDQLSLEHIWASKNMADDFPEQYHTKRRLGNFVLCGLSSNISLSDNYITDKIATLVNIGTEYNRIGDGALDMLQVSALNFFLKNGLTDLVGKRQTKNYWRDLANKICDLREQKLIEFALKRWALPNDKAI